MIDIGSRINIIGANTEKTHARAINPFGQKHSYASRSPLLVKGGGKGGTSSKQIATTPIAVTEATGKVTKEVFKANVVEGSGSDLPAMMGNQSMEEKDAVIILRKGKQLMVFPGPAGYKIEWSPGTKLLPLVQTTSGHLVLPCDSFEKAITATDRLTFATDNRQ